MILEPMALSFHRESFKKIATTKRLFIRLNQMGATIRVVKTFVTEAMNYNNFSYISEGLSETSMLVDKGARLVNNNEDVKLVN